MSSWGQSRGAVGFVLLFDSDVILSPSTRISSSDTYLIDHVMLREACGIHSRKGVGCVLMMIHRVPARDS